MEYPIYIAAGLLFAGAVVFGANVWLLNRTVTMLFERLGDQDEFIRASANTQAYVTVEERAEMRARPSEPRPYTAGNVIE